jgi:hypothetical protein
MEQIKQIRAMKKPLDTMENDRDMHGQGFNYAIDKVLKILDAEPSQPSSGADRPWQEWVDYLDRIISAQIATALLSAPKAEPQKTKVPMAMLRELGDDGEYHYPDSQLIEIANRYNVEVENI